MMRSLNSRGRQYVYSPSKTHRPVETYARRRWCSPAARVWLRQYERRSIRSCSSTISERQSRTIIRPAFPWHPHRGIETITYVLAGSVEHGDSLGNRGSLGAGDVQWMTAGSGILHQEMPKGDSHGRMHGFQLWANLPSSLKMTAPRYQDVNGADIPEVVDDDGTRAHVICGSFWGKTGPVDGVAADPRYLDIFVPPGVRKRSPRRNDPQRFRLRIRRIGTVS